MAKVSITEDQFAASLAGALFFFLFCLAGSLAAWNDGTPSPFMTFLGYGHWFFATDPDPVKKYLLSRPWHIVPLITLTVSFLLVFKTLITGKCAFLKGTSFGEVVGGNFFTLVIFITPMGVELIIILALLAGIVVALVKAVIWVTNRFDNACNCAVETKSPAGVDRHINASEVKNMEIAFFSSIKGENGADEYARSPIKTAKITSPYFSQKKYRQGR